MPSNLAKAAPGPSFSGMRGGRVVYKMIDSATKEPTSHLTDLDGVAQFVDGGDIRSSTAERNNQGVESL